MTGVQGVSTLRNILRRPREHGRAAADSIGEPMEFVIYPWWFLLCVDGSPNAFLFPHNAPHNSPHNSLHHYHHPRSSSRIFLILTPTPQMENLRAEQEQPPRERLPPVTTAAHAPHPARTSSAGNQPVADTGSHPAWAANTSNLPVRGPSSAACGPFPGPLRSARAPQVGKTTVPGRSPDWVVAAGQAAIVKGIRTARPNLYAVTPPVVVTPSPGWLQTGVRAVLNLLHGADLDYQVSRGGRNPSQGQPPMTVDAYVGTSFPDTARLGAIPKRRGISTLCPHSRVRQENRPAAWRTPWLHTGDSRLPSDLLYIRGADEDHYHGRLFQLFERFRGDVYPEPHVRLVAYPRLFDRWYSVADRVR